MNLSRRTYNKPWAFRSSLPTMFVRPPGVSGFMGLVWDALTLYASSWELALEAES
jgi:hypothetical protein